MHLIDLPQLLLFVAAVLATCHAVPIPESESVVLMRRGPSDNRTAGPKRQNHEVTPTTAPPPQNPNQQLNTMGDLLGSHPAEQLSSGPHPPEQSFASGSNGPHPPEQSFASGSNGPHPPERSFASGSNGPHPPEQSFASGSNSPHAGEQSPSDIKGKGKAN